jgi:hypothetical protein
LVKNDYAGGYLLHDRQNVRGEQDRSAVAGELTKLMKRDLLFLAQRLTAMVSHHHEGQTKFAAREKAKPSKPARKPEAKTAKKPAA